MSFKIRRSNEPEPPEESPLDAFLHRLTEWWVFQVWGPIMDWLDRITGGGGPPAGRA